MIRVLYAAARFIEIIVLAVVTVILTVAGYFLYVNFWEKGAGSPDEILYKAGAVFIWSAIGFIVVLAAVVFLGLIWYLFTIIDLLDHKNMYAFLHAVFRAACLYGVCYVLHSQYVIIRGMIEDGSIMKVTQQISSVLETVFFWFWNSFLPNYKA